MLHTLHSWLTVNKDVIDSTLQALLLVVTCGLIVVGALQARAAHVQATAARDQIAASSAQQEELLSQGIAARRPFFSLEIPNGTDDVVLKNSGPGIAFKTVWRLKESEPYNVSEAIGAVGVDAVLTLTFAKRDGTRQTLKHQTVREQRGIWITYEDSSGKQYWSEITKAPEGHILVNTGDYDQPQEQR
jgi:hypothetical protein